MISARCSLPNRPKAGYIPALVACLCLFMISGCAVGPDFQPPLAKVPENWAGPIPGGEPGVPAGKDLARWWTLFEDPVLSSLVQRALESNLDLRLAEARILQTRAAMGVAASGLGPSVNATGSFRRSQTPGSSSVALARGGSDAQGPTTNQYQAGFDALWELDFFGGIRRGVEAASADYEAAVESRRDVLVTLTAEVARNYFDLRAYQQRIAIARQNLAAQKHSALITRQRFQGGFASGLDVANAEAQAASTAAQIPLLEAASLQGIYRISVLIGREPAALSQELSPPEEIPAAATLVPLGVPSELLRRRPDIRRVEAEIHAATARIGVATADLFPKFTLTGSFGFQAADSSSWLDATSRFWGFGPGVRWPVFDMGRIRSNIAQREALLEQSLITYEKTVLTALREVEDALIALAKEEEHREATKEAVAANRKAVKLATQLYTEGQTDFLNVLQSQRSLYLTEDALVQSTAAIATDLVALFKALGGGWESKAVTTDTVGMAEKPGRTSADAMLSRNPPL